MSRIQDGWFAFDNDLNSALDALAGTYVSSGGACTEKGTPNMSVNVAEIYYYVGATKAHKVATNVVIGAAPGSGARKDIIVGDNAGNLSVVAGTPENVAPAGSTGPETYNPKPPNIPADKVLIAEVWVVTGATTILNADITDRRVVFAPLPECGAKVRHNAAQSIPDESYTALSWNVEDFDTDDIHDTVTNNNRLTCKTDGIYLVVANIVWGVNASGVREASIYINQAEGAEDHRPALAVMTTNTVAALFELDVGDWAQVIVWHNAGVAVNVASQPYCHFVMIRIGAAGGLTPHATEHQDGGSDEVDLTALSGLLTDDQHVLDAEVLAVAAALVHKNRHKSGGADELTSTDLLEAIVKRIQESGGPTTLTVGAIAVGEYVKRSGATLIGGTPAGGAGLYSDYIHIREEQASGTNGGTFTQDAWQTRVLNQEKADTGNDAALASNQITLEAGTYRCLISCPGFRCDGHKAQLYNITDAATEIMGSSEWMASGQSVQSRSFVVGRFTLAAQKVLEVQHYCITTRANDGRGRPINIGVIEVYTEVELWKEV